MCFKNIILLATTMDEDFDWVEYDNCFENVLVCWSPDDNVVGQSTYGAQGLVGPKRQHPRVTVVRREGMHHFDWITPKSLDSSSLSWAHFLKS